MLLPAKEIERYVREYSGPVPPLLDELEKETRKKTAFPQMLTGKVEGMLLRMVVGISGARKAVEIGTFTGYSALLIAEGLPDNGKLITCEISKEYAAIAQSYFRRSPSAEKIDLRLGPAIESLRRIEDASVDFVFIDADKASYPAYYEESVRILAEGGIAIADNVLWGGRVLSPPDSDSRAIAAFNRKVKDDKRVEKVMLAIRDGVYLIRKK
ncbi:MAG TPA: class I SAM-dependent methyltransferase [Dissulfurispiraceae bacterium]